MKGWASAYTSTTGYNLMNRWTDCSKWQALACPYVVNCCVRALSCLLEEHSFHLPHCMAPPTLQFCKLESTFFTVWHRWCVHNDELQSNITFSLRNFSLFFTTLAELKATENIEGSVVSGGGRYKPWKPMLVCFCRGQSQGKLSDVSH